MVIYNHRRGCMANAIYNLLVCSPLIHPKSLFYCECDLGGSAISFMYRSLRKLNKSGLDSKIIGVLDPPYSRLQLVADKPYCTVYRPMYAVSQKVYSQVSTHKNETFNVSAKHDTFLYIFSMILLNISF